MNALERQLATLLADAPGEPPNTLDPDALVGHPPSRRRRYVAPLLAAAAVAAIAIPVGFALTSDSNPPTAAPESPAPTPRTSSTSSPSPDTSMQRAIAQAQELLLKVPLLPGAQSIGESPISELDQPSTTTMVPTLIIRTRFWLAPGDTDGAIAYFRAHPPAGMHEGASGLSSGVQPDTQFVDFESGRNLKLQLTVVDFQGGVAVRADAQVIRVPDRPRWAYVSDSVTSAEVTVIREALDPAAGGAPTVQRTVTGETLEQLARAVNGLPSRAPEGIHGCVAMSVRVQDRVVFHSSSGDLKVVLGGCSFNAAISAPFGTRYAYVDAGQFRAAVLAAVGLPSNYGLQR